VGTPEFNADPRVSSNASRCKKTPKDFLDQGDGNLMPELGSQA